MAAAAGDAGAEVAAGLAISDPEKSPAGTLFDGMPANGSAVSGKLRSSMRRELVD
ncbi:MAG TPA: hypothetical protein VGJ04_03885 [Pirellulales bacterium]